MPKKPKSVQFRLRPICRPRGIAAGRAGFSIQVGSAYFRLFQLNSGYFRVTNKKGFRGNPATCCRFVADVLPIKSLTINNVADVADFQSNMSKAEPEMNHCKSG